MDSTKNAEDMATPARDQLQRAYLCLGFGQYQEAIDACEAAAELAPGHPLPPTLKGSFEMAVGRVGEALGTLRAVTRRHREEPLATLYFAEACFLAGRRQQAERALAGAAQMPMSEDLRAFMDELRRTWTSVQHDVVPPPLIARVAVD
jgi:predicted Zn-dependent protease